MTAATSHGRRVTTMGQPPLTAFGLPHRTSHEQRARGDRSRRNAFLGGNGVAVQPAGVDRCEPTCITAAQHRMRRARRRRQARPGAWRLAPGLRQAHRTDRRPTVAMNTRIRRSACGPAFGSGERRGGRVAMSRSRASPRRGALRCYRVAPASVARAGPTVLHTTSAQRLPERVDEIGHDRGSEEAPQPVCAVSEL